MQVSKWGNSLAVRLPAQLVEQMQLRVGDHIALRPGVMHEGVRQTIVDREPTREDLFRLMDRHRKMRSKHFEFDREEANSRG